MKKNELMSLIRHVTNGERGRALKIDDVQAVLAGLAAVAQEEMGRGQKFTIPGLCSLRFEVSKPRKGRNPRTGEALDIPAKLKIKAKPDTALAKLLQPSKSEVG